MSALVFLAVCAWVFRCGLRMGEQEERERQGRARAVASLPPHDQATFERAMGVAR